MKSLNLANLHQCKPLRQSVQGEIKHVDLHWTRRMWEKKIEEARMVAFGLDTPIPNVPFVGTMEKISQ